VLDLSLLHIRLASQSFGMKRRKDVSVLDLLLAKPKYLETITESLKLDNIIYEVSVSMRDE
jgi:hypothetical protein